MEKAVIVRDSETARACATGVGTAVCRTMALKAGSRRTDRPHYPLLDHLCRRGALSEMIGVRRKTRALVSRRDADTPHRIPIRPARSPLAHSARRREPDGTVSEPRDSVHAGERLREDFREAQMAATLTP